VDGRKTGTRAIVVAESDSVMVSTFGDPVDLPFL
jgi:hypothetical protein